jgi:hypothetical protein
MEVITWKKKAVAGSIKQLPKKKKQLHKKWK